MKDHLKNHLRNLLAENKVVAVFEILNSLKGIDESQLTAIKARYNRHQEAKIKGIKKEEDLQVEINNITTDIINFIDGHVYAFDAKANQTKWGLLGSLLIIAAACLGYYLRGINLKEPKISEHKEATSIYQQDAIKLVDSLQKSKALLEEERIERTQLEEERDSLNGVINELRVSSPSNCMNDLSREKRKNRQLRSDLNSKGSDLERCRSDLRQCSSSLAKHKAKAPTPPRKIIVIGDRSYHNKYQEMQQQFSSITIDPISEAGAGRGPKIEFKNKQDLKYALYVFEKLNGTYSLQEDSSIEQGVICNSSVIFQSTNSLIF